MSFISQQALVNAKISIPAPGPHTIARPRLVDELREGLRRPLTLVTAPAGFGKTTMVADVLRS